MTKPRGPAEVGRPDADVISKVQRTCAAVSDNPVIIAEAFYRHLFDMAPAVRGMFAEDMSLQHERMCRILLEAVAQAAQNPGAVELTLQRMGAQHARHFDVVPEHYPYVGRALVRAVRELSPEWSTDVGSAWIQVYEWLAAHMVLGGERGTGLYVANPLAVTSREARWQPEAPEAAAPRNGHRPNVTSSGRTIAGRLARLGLRRHRQATPARPAATYSRHGVPPADGYPED
jgi:hemoglobin-like flavoprotein